MSRRTTIEIDEELLSRARALGTRTTKETVEGALRRAADSPEDEFARRRAGQIRYLKNLADHVDLSVLGSDEMWRQRAGFSIRTQRLAPQNRQSHNYWRRPRDTCICVRSEHSARLVTMTIVRR
jgi:Arc/MetJ family transcription regulator